MTPVRTASLDSPAWRTWHDPVEPIRVGISSCLLGQLYLEPHPNELMLRNRV